MKTTYRSCKSINNDCKQQCCGGIECHVTSYNTLPSCKPLSGKNCEGLFCCGSQNCSVENYSSNFLNNSNKIEAFSCNKNLYFYLFIILIIYLLII